MHVANQLFHLHTFEGLTIWYLKWKRYISINIIMSAILAHAIVMGLQSLISSKVQSWNFKRKVVSWLGGDCFCRPVFAVVADVDVVVVVADVDVVVKHLTRVHRRTLHRNGAKASLFSSSSLLTEASRSILCQRNKQRKAIGEKLDFSFSDTDPEKNWFRLFSRKKIILQQKESFVCLGWLLNLRKWTQARQARHVAQRDN